MKPAKGPNINTPAALEMPPGIMGMTTCKICKRIKIIGPKIMELPTKPRKALISLKTPKLKKYIVKAIDTKMPIIEIVLIILRERAILMVSSPLFGILVLYKEFFYLPYFLSDNKQTKM